MPLPCDDLTVVSSAHLISTVGGFLGGASLLSFMKPVSVRDGINRIFVSTISGAMLAPILAVKIFDANADADSQVVMGCAFAIGFVAWNILGAVAQFFKAKQGQDIVQLAKSVKTIDPIGE